MNATAATNATDATNATTLVSSARSGRQLSRILTATTSDLYGSQSSHGGYNNCPGIPLCLLIALFAGLAAFYRVLCIAITKAGRKRRRRDLAPKPAVGAVGADRQTLLSLVQGASSLSDVLYSGLEEFEDRIDKLAGGSNTDESSWIGQMYNKLKGSLLDTSADENAIDGANMDGLEPPLLVDTWGLDDLYEPKNETMSAFASNSNSTVLGHASNSTRSAQDGSPRRRSKRAISDDVSSDDNAVGMPKTEEAAASDPITDGFIGMFFGGDNCKVVFYKCIAKVAKGSAHYMNEPNGLYNLFQKTLVRVAFHGNFGNVWNALMTIPEAREVRRCMNAQEKCIGYEAIRKEADDSGENVNPRLIVNPEFVEDLDKSDGANQFDPEDEKKFNEALGEDY